MQAREATGLVFFLSCNSFSKSRLNKIFNSLSCILDETQGYRIIVLDSDKDQAHYGSLFSP